MMMYKVLDHGYVQAVDHMGDDLDPLRSARMSTDNPTGVDDKKDERLRERLWEDKHTSPFESNYVTFEMQLPLFVLRQLDRHRTLRIQNTSIEVIEDYDEHRVYTNRNEFSGRYAEMPDLYYVPPTERIRKKGVTNKQGSGEPLEADHQHMVQSEIQHATQVAREAYDNIGGTGCASEIARLVLPQNQYTKIRMTGCLLHWLKFFDLRLRTDVQEETRAYAQCMALIVRQLWPRCWGVFEEHTLYGSHLTGTDRKVLHKLLAQPAFQDLLGVLARDRGYTEQQIRKLEKKLAPEPEDLLSPLDCVRLEKWTPQR